VHGHIETPKTGTGACTGGAVDALEQTGGSTVTELPPVKQLPAPVPYPIPAVPSPAPPTTHQSLSGSVNLCGTGASTITGCSETGANQIDFAPGSYGDVSINNETLQLSAGTYTMNSLNLSGGAIVRILSGPVILQLAGNSMTGTTPVLGFGGPSTLATTRLSARGLQVIVRSRPHPQ